MPLDPHLLRASFDLAVTNQPELTARFYEILFERYPQVKPLFGRNSNANQANMLQGALVAVMDHLDDATWLADTLTAMGKKHVDYGVTDEMFDWVGASLLAALAEAAGDRWTPEVEAAWIEAYGAIAGLMQQGARDARAA
ncbi:MAG TPA: globin domain-containing protein [Polyangiales bacterium]|jgi:hemoglobin-like flavoprotein|nr:globin domain-containing protein [Polyangiales bacterium]